MKLTLKIKLLPNEKQSVSLLNTIREFNTVCNSISETIFEQKIYNQFKVHNIVYHNIKQSFKISSQLIVRAISKAVDSYKAGKKGIKRTFKPLGSITYDSRVLSYKNDTASISTIDGRLKMPFVCHNPALIPYIKGEADLLHHKGKFYLYQTVDIPDETIDDVETILGVDFGVNSIATLSDGTDFASASLNAVRDRYSKIRSSVQSKGTKGSKRFLKRLTGKEKRYASIVNHTISKHIVSKAKTQNMGIAIEDLTNIRTTTKVRKTQRRKHHSWSFYQLRQYLTYKAQIAGVPLIVVEPAYTSKTCNVCNHIGTRQSKHFSCNHCGNIADADINAALNIAQLGMNVIHAENSVKHCCALAA